MLYTDGVTDQGPAAQHTPEQALRGLSGERSANTLADALRAEAGQGAGPPRADIAIVVLR